MRSVAFTNHIAVAGFFKASQSPRARFVVMQSEVLTLPLYVETGNARGHGRQLLSRLQRREHSETDLTIERDELQLNH